MQKTCFFCALFYETAIKTNYIVVFKVDHWWMINEKGSERSGCGLIKVPYQKWYGLRKCTKSLETQCPHKYFKWAHSKTESGDWLTATSTCSARTLSIHTDNLTYFDNTLPSSKGLPLQQLVMYITEKYTSQNIHHSSQHPKIIARKLLQIFISRTNMQLYIWYFFLKT